MKDETPYKSPLRGKYLIRNSMANGCMALADLLLSPLCLKKPKPIPKPKSILLSNTAQLGDLVLATSLLPLLKETFPEIKIGFLAGGWGKGILEKHPLLHCFHQLDHWKQTRASKPLKVKLKEYAAQRKQVLNEIKEENYEVACELNFYFPSMSPLFFQARIPYRIGYTSAGLAPFLTHRIKWENKPQSAAHYFLDLLAPLFPVSETKLKSSLPPISKTPKQPSQQYCIIHMGSGNAAKEWPLSQWRTLAELLSAQGHYLVFTGKGEKEERDIQTVTQNLTRTLNLCNQLDWNAYVALIKEAKLLIGVDTSAGHVAAAVETPSVLLYSGLNPLTLWRPLGTKATVLQAPVPCAPCYRMSGCSSLACIRNVSVEEVLEKSLEILSR